MKTLISSLLRGIRRQLTFFRVYHLRCRGDKVEYLRANGLKRSLYLAYLHVVSPLLEPLRRFVVGFLMPSGKKKTRVLAPVFIACVLVIALLRLWLLVPVLLVLVLLVYFQRYMRVKLQPVLWLRYWQAHRDELLKSGDNGYVLTVDSLGLPAEGLRALRAELAEWPEVVIADIDQDGFLLSRFGPIPDVPNVDQEGFLKRKRRPLKVVAMGNKVGVKKYYHGNKVRFLNELEVLNSLAGRCNVPAILDADFNNLTITFSYIPGAVIREELAKRGAVIRNRDIDGDPEFRRLTRKEQRHRRVAEARRVMSAYLDRPMVDDIFSELKKIHRAGILLSDIKYGNIIIERDSGKPYFIDFDDADSYGHPGSLRWQARRDFEIERFNLFFATEKPTRDRMLRKITEFSKSSSIRRYGSVDFGYGVAMGRTWDVEFGEGRWHYILKPNLPPLSGKRVLDLGCKNALFSLQMLRHGAREAVGVEHDEVWIKQAQFVKEGFEWADSTTYNLEVIKARMEEVPTLELSRFDLVIALGSLYHVRDEWIDDVVRHVGTLTDHFFVQCNTETEEGSPDIRLKASVDYNVQLLERNGFYVGRVVAPLGYKCPLLIATKV
jgi:2-polyprenyl-3-methyl-5-hydroxy-6-metoxy-1,4-benzoquinol methylase